MTPNQKLINKAKKIALMLQSPYENEVIVAASLLKKADHNTSMQALGLQNVNFDRIIKNEVCNDRIVEVIYKQPYSSMSNWLRDMVVKIARVYDAKAVVDQNDRILFVGYSSDIEIVKIMVVSLKAYIQSQIIKRCFKLFCRTRRPNSIKYWCLRKSYQAI
jgi:hypothetical protein